MLYLIQRNRLGKNIVNKGEDAFNWREAFKASEDSLTSSVFSLLFYLPADIFWEILYKACYHPSIPIRSGRLLSYDFWPHWNCKDTGNTNFVEPDIFLEFEDFHVIIEAKRYDYAEQQSKSQWEAEIIAYRNEYSIDLCKPLYFIALAGILNGDEKQNPVLSIPVTTCRWRNIFTEVKKIISKCSKERSIENVDSILNILNDLVLTFALHGFRTGDLLESLPNFYKINQAVDLSLNINFVKLKKLNLPNFPTSLKNIKYSSQNIPL